MWQQHGSYSSDMAAAWQKHKAEPYGRDMSVLQVNGGWRIRRRAVAATDGSPGSVGSNTDFAKATSVASK